MKILCIGDSNTYGYDPRSYLGSRYPEDVRWTDRLKGFDVINRGVNGMTALRARSGCAALVTRTDPDLVVIMLGTNDILGGISAEETASRMEVLIDSVLESGKQVLLIAPPVLEYGEWVPAGDQIEESIELGGLYRELADEKDCLFADSGEWGIGTTFDGVHFSPEGHERFALKLQEVLDQLQPQTE